MKTFKIKFLRFSKIIKAKDYKIACGNALKYYFKKYGHPKKLPFLIQINEKIKYGWKQTWWSMLEALKYSK